MVGLRPNASEARPHTIAVVHWESEKTAEVIPAQLATSFLSIPKDSIISGLGGQLGCPNERFADLQGKDRPRSGRRVPQIYILLGEVSKLL